MTGAEDDEYETPEQAVRRQMNAAGIIELEVLDVENAGYETITEYAAFNDPEIWKPLFASGEVPEALRNMVDDPLFTSNNLRSAVRFADMRNDERAHNDTIGKYGPVVVRVRTIVRSPWSEVSYDEIDRVRRR